MSESYLSVTQINTYIKAIFDAEVMLQNICVYGEVSSYNISNNIAYFNLKDENGLLACVLFGANNFDIPKIGDMILVRGSLSYYVKGGKLSFNAVSIMPYGKGLLYEKFLQLKEKLASAGYFDDAHKKPIPKMVKRIGVVSSQTGAVIRDIIDVTHRRNDTIDIVLYPVKVQGVGAEKEIANGIEFFSNYPSVDVIIVARGGGSIEDLEPFNTEIVANATYNCEKPIVSAVGHETDFTIIDFVADLRAPTPSAAAELVAWEKMQFKNDISANLSIIEKNLKNKILFYKKDLDFLSEKMDNIATNNIIRLTNLINSSVSNLDIFEKTLENKLQEFNLLDVKLKSLNPEKISHMGYSKVIQNGKSISNKKKLKSGTATISMIDGSVECTVNG